MDIRPLVDRELAWGREVHEALDRAGLPYVAAMWMADPERNTWHFVVALPTKTDGPLRNFGLVRTKLRAAGLDESEFADRLKVIRRNELPLATMAERIRHLGLKAPLRWYGELLDGRRVEDAYVYKIAA
jgi:hypothetical protein